MFVGYYGLVGQRRALSLVVVPGESAKCALRELKFFLLGCYCRVVGRVVYYGHVRRGGFCVLFSFLFGVLVVQMCSRFVLSNPPNVSQRALLLVCRQRAVGERASTIHHSTYGQEISDRFPQLKKETLGSAFCSFSCCFGLESIHLCSMRRIDCGRL